MEIQIFYGVEKNMIDIKNICIQKISNNIFIIPKGDENRARLFTDPVYGVKKSIFIHYNNQIFEVNENYEIIIVKKENEYFLEIVNNEEKLKSIHSKLKLKYGTFKDEYPEQLMACTYITGSEKVLEIGGNIGRNSCVIAHILNSKNNNNFVCLECDPIIANQLSENKDLNKLDFHIECSALSKRKLVQKGWDTFVCDDNSIYGNDYKLINTITYEQLLDKYKIQFDTLVLDCEGAFYYILMDMPEILNNINTIIMENDYYDFEKKIYVDNVLKNNNFYLVFNKAGGWQPCYSCFFQVWKKSL